MGCIISGDRNSILLIALQTGLVVQGKYQVIYLLQLPDPILPIVLALRILQVKLRAHSHRNPIFYTFENPHVLDGSAQ